MKVHNIILISLIGILFSNCEKNDLITELKSEIPTEILPHSTKITSEIISLSTKEQVVAKGICWSFFENPQFDDARSWQIIDQSNENKFTLNIDDLKANTTYYLRAFTTTESGITYGNQIEFKTPDYLIFNPDIQYGTVTDYDGNEYKTVTIGTQTWMAENLRTTHFQNGDPISLIESSGWSLNFAEPAYTWYNKIEPKIPYGAYYHWSAVSDERNIAPEGWRVATSDDWSELFDYVGYNNAIVLRESTSAHWPIVKWLLEGNNVTGFTAISTGISQGEDYFFGIRDSWAIFWTPNGELGFAICAMIEINKLSLMQRVQTNRGYPVRCIKE